MWVLTNVAWLSIVADRDVPGNLMVRARGKGQLVQCFGFGIEHCVQHTPGADYAWRISLPRGAVAAVIAGQVADVNYDNFKNSVVDGRLHDAYMQVWQVGWRFQQAECPPPPPRPLQGELDYGPRPYGRYNHWPRQPIVPTPAKGSKAKGGKGKRKAKARGVK